MKAAAGDRPPRPGSAGNGTASACLRGTSRRPSPGGRRARGCSPNGKQLLHGPPTPPLGPTRGAARPPERLATSDSKSATFLQPQPARNGPEGRSSGPSSPPPRAPRPASPPPRPPRNADRHTDRLTSPPEGSAGGRGPLGRTRGYTTGNGEAAGFSASPSTHPAAIFLRLPELTGHVAAKPGARWPRPRRAGQRAGGEAGAGSGRGQRGGRDARVRVARPRRPPHSPSGLQTGISLISAPRQYFLHCQCHSSYYG